MKFRLNNIICGKIYDVKGKIPDTAYCKYFNGKVKVLERIGNDGFKCQLIESSKNWDYLREMGLILSTKTFKFTLNEV